MDDPADHAGSRRQKHVVTLPAGVPFLRTVAEALGDGRLLPEFRLDPADPLSLAKVTIYVPTRRSVRVLRSEFVDLLGGRSAILPLIRPLGEADDDIGFLDPEDPAILDLAEPLGAVPRLLELARLILAWRNRLPQAILDLHGDTPLVAPASPADAVWLARDLSSLIDQLETEDLDWDRLDRLSVGDYSHWWQLSADFLGVASRFWPARLAELGRSSPARYRNALLRLEARRLSTMQHDGPVIVAGSTGSLTAAADLINAVSALAQGAVVLPGLDKSMSDAEFTSVAPVAAAGERDDPSWRCHPQFGMSRLLARMGLTRDDVPELVSPPPDLACRARVISAAMAPAAATDSWSQWRAEADPAEIEAAFGDVGLIEAVSEREEALAIAVALKLTLSEDETGRSRAALITPDRNLARRVVAELVRFGVTADDTAGMPLASTAAGTLLLLLAEAVLRPGDPVAVAGLLKHPLARFGFVEDRYDAAVRALEVFALRGRTDAVDLSMLGPIFAAGVAAHRADRHPAPWRASVTPNAIADAAELADRIASAVEPLASVLASPHGGPRQKHPVDDWAERSGRVIEAAVRREDDSLDVLWGSETGASLAALLTGIIESGDILEADGPQWIDILRAFMAGEKVKPAALGNPRVFIFGTLEARLQSVETMVLGGLNEGNWPGAAESNPFLSRLMKTEIGLEPPERRVGQLAHDFEMANGTRRLIYSRSLRQGTAPTVPSRWLQRLLALAGEKLAGDLRARGAPYLAMARSLDLGESRRAARRPAPKPPASVQPQSYSFSEAGRLRRDPYAIYARRILRLAPLDPFNTDPGARERGTLYHRIVERCIAEKAFAEPALLAIVDQEFDAAALPQHVETVWRPRAREMARAFLRFETNRQGEIVTSSTEVRARYQLTPALAITGIADRIDLRRDGKADIIDYKTGSSPSTTQARALLDPQLPLEAAALSAGAFAGIAPLAVQDLVYVRLKPGGRFKAETVNNEGGRAREPVTAPELSTRATVELVRFVETLARGEQGFMSRLIPESDRGYGGEYDHLARVAEWSVAEEGEEGGEEAGDE